MQGFVVRTFIFENQINSQSHSLTMTLQDYCQIIDIQQIINIFKRLNSIQQVLLLKIYNPITSSYDQVNIKEGLSYFYLIPNIVFIKYKSVIQKNQQPISDSNEQTPQQQKKQRNKQRTIKQVVFYVKKWRQTHKTLNSTRPKINLQQAAKIVGIAKKSLDDYYSQLRLAEKYGFDFQKHFNKKIGILRTFVKNHKQRECFDTKYQKLSKKLKIIEEYDLHHQQKHDIKAQFQQQVNETVVDIQQQILVLRKIQTISEQKFYNSFNFMLDDPQNPFVKQLIEKRNPQQFKQQLLLF